MSFGEGAELTGLCHPYASLFPVVDERELIVDTKLWPGRRFEYLAEDLVGPTLGGLTGRSALLDYLGRMINIEGDENGWGRRFVEPGIGRSYLVDFLRFETRPELTDFSVLGVGLTPYSRDGFALTGPHVDGLTSLKRALHRHRNSERLHEAGCRVVRTAAIITLAGVQTTMPDETQEPAALIARGFRSVFRVKQLDPVACLYDSLKHRPQVLTFLMESRWASGGSEQTFHPDALAGIARALSRLGFASNCLRHLVTPQDPPAGDNPFYREARARRLRVIYCYAPMMLRLAKAKVAEELGRDPTSAPLSDDEYVSWFAGTLGSQLAVMKKLRFLHDYHHPGVGRNTSQWIYTLCETNITLLAEFPDLDTAIFVDRIDDETSNALRISGRDATILRDEYERFHEKDLEQAAAVVRTLASIAHRGDAAKTSQSVERFQSAYRDELSPAHGSTGDLSDNR